MKLIINTSNLHGGGGVQVGFSFIEECVNFREHEYHVFLCHVLKRQIDTTKFPDNFYFYDFPIFPSTFLSSCKIIKRLKKLEKKIQPDCVFSIFGPTYWTPKAPHLMGYAIPHFLYSESPFFDKISFKEKQKWSLMKIIKRFYILQNANYYHVETENLKLILSKFLNCPSEIIYTVSNTYNSSFDTVSDKLIEILPFKENGEFRFVCISAYYSHKNLEILNRIIPLLIKKRLLNVKFILTIDQNIFESKFSEIAKQQIINIGSIPIKKCPQLYNECDALFLPTLLECFSSNYPEAMKMQKPILTSDLSFTHDICANAAIYFDPMDEVDIVDSINRLLNNNELKFDLIKKGNERLKSFNTAKERAAKYLQICKEITTGV